MPSHEMPKEQINETDHINSISKENHVKKGGYHRQLIDGFSLDDYINANQQKKNQKHELQRAIEWFNNLQLRNEMGSSPSFHEEMGHTFEAKKLEPKAKPFADKDQSNTKLHSETQSSNETQQNESTSSGNFQYNPSDRFISRYHSNSETRLYPDSENEELTSNTDVERPESRQYLETHQEQQKELENRAKREVTNDIAEIINTTIEDNSSVFKDTVSSTRTASIVNLKKRIVRSIEDLYIHYNSEISDNQKLSSAKTAFLLDFTKYNVHGDAVNIAIEKAEKHYISDSGSPEEDTTSENLTSGEASGESHPSRVSHHQIPNIGQQEDFAKQIANQPTDTNCQIRDTSIVPSQQQRHWTDKDITPAFSEDLASLTHQDKDKASVGSVPNFTAAPREGDQTKTSFNIYNVKKEYLYDLALKDPGKTSELISSAIKNNKNKHDMIIENNKTLLDVFREIQTNFAYTRFYMVDKREQIPLHIDDIYNCLKNIKDNINSIKNKIQLKSPDLIADSIQLY